MKKSSKYKIILGVSLIIIGAVIVIIRFDLQQSGEDVIGFALIFFGIMVLATLIPSRGYSRTTWRGRWRY